MAKNDMDIHAESEHLSSVSRVWRDGKKYYDPTTGEKEMV